ncbi:MAG: TetR/AcrR family transcriptional regulator [Acidimicrobiaceae bacterium]|nr:TetR/AcrR family transcriptional regulator [Acidimicrobiaceae bacterium]
MDQAIRTATLDLLAGQGYSRLTIEGVALRAGVAKTSLYRRWSTKESLVLDAIVNAGLAEQPALPDTGTLHEDMLSYLCAWVRFRRAQAWASEVIANSELKHAFRKSLGDGLTSGFRAILERAVERADLPPHTDVELMATLPMALIHQHYVLTGKPADEELAKRIADQFFSAAPAPCQDRKQRS